MDEFMNFLNFSGCKGTYAFHSFLFQTFQIDDNYCGQHEINTPIAGSEAVSADAVLYMEGTSATSIAVMVTHEYTVAFVGTGDGQLKKVRYLALQSFIPWASCQIRKIVGCTCAANATNVFPATAG